MSIGLRLKVKYGLVGEPTADAALRWAVATAEHIQAGSPAEDAGRQAAKDVFPDYDTMLYQSEADTVLALLQQIKERPGPSGR